MEKQRILLVEDDVNFGNLLRDTIAFNDYEVDLERDGVQGLRAYKQGDYDLCIFDIMMPKKDGFTLAKEIRQINKQVPILFLTAKSMSDDTLEGFKAGADDYMTKPFSMDELLVRINAILRRTSSIPELGDETKTYTIGKYEFDYNKQKLVSPDTDTKLTTKENELLYLLCKNKNGVLERNHALNMIWGDDNYFNGRSMDVYIAKLRKHLKADEKIQILNVHGRGFKLLDE